MVVQQLGSYADHLSTGAERGEVDGAVVRTLRWALVSARREIAAWSRPVLAAPRMRTPTKSMGTVTTSGAFDGDVVVQQRGHTRPKAQTRSSRTTRRAAAVTGYVSAPAAAG
jgi:hypothetical protein